MIGDLLDSTVCLEAARTISYKYAPRALRSLGSAMIKIPIVNNPVYVANPAGIEIVFRFYGALATSSL